MTLIELADGVTLDAIRDKTEASLRWRQTLKPRRRETQP